MGFLGAIPSGLYSLGLRIRHFMYDSGMLKSRRYDVPVVCVGNITVGGTGKTPVAEYLIEHLGGEYDIAVLSRGYGRRTKGYLEVDVDSPFRDVGDEPKQMKRKFPGTTIVVCEDRREGIRLIKERHPGTNLILLDDGFQHRRVTPKVNIVLVDYTRPVWADHLLPWGSLRDLKSQLARANIIIVTKTPEDMSPIERRLTVKLLAPLPYQSVFFTSMERQKLTALFPDAEGLVAPGADVAVMAGIGNPGALTDSLRGKHNIVDTWLFRDHHVYKVGELKRIEQALSQLPADTIIVTTEKDAVKLTNRRKIPLQIQRRLYVLPVKLRFPEGDQDKFLKLLVKDIRAKE